MSNYTLKCLIVSDLALSLTVTSGFRTYEGCLPDE